MKTALVLCALALSLAGCDDTRQTEVGRRDFRASQIAYFADHHTDLCFAVAKHHYFGWNSSESVTITYVPCTAEVRKMIDQTETMMRRLERE
jgi:hypothetical protein